MMPDPDPLDVTPWLRRIPAGLDTELLHENYVRGYRSGRSIPRWYLLASFVTGLLLGAAVARL